jgi:hypothetical protein
VRRLVLILTFICGIAAPVVAQVEQAEHPKKLDDMSLREREHEMQAEHWQGPSGFWTSPHPAKGSPYRYRLMAIGAVLLIGMTVFTVRLMRKASAERDARG